MIDLPLGPLMVDLVGQTLAADERDLLHHPAVGAVILFTRNYHSKTQVTALVNEIKSVRSPSLLVAVDQEGGRVQRFKSDFYKLPALDRLGKLYDHDHEGGIAMAEAAGRLMAAEVLQTGVDFSFSPVLDCRNPRSKVIGDRAFHQDPTAICELAGAYITGMNRAGMAATGKHFPGHGGVAADSHTELPVDSRSMGELEGRDLLPFAHLANRLGGIMTAHIMFRKINHQLPTYSSFWLQQILRQQLGFGGLIFSDDLSMKGAGADDDMSTKCVMTLNAGCDMALVCNDKDNARRVADSLGQKFPCDQARLLSMRAGANRQNDLVGLVRMVDTLT